MYNVFTSSVVGLRLLPAAVFIYCQETRRGGANARPDVAFFLAVAKLRFADKLCSACAEHGRPKVPMRKLSPSQSMKTEVHAPGFHEFASKFH